MATHSQGTFGKLIIEPSDTPAATGHTYVFDSSSIRIEFLYEDIALRRRIIGKRRGIRGTLSRNAARGREGMRMVRGRIVTYLTPDVVDLLADDVWGMSESPSGTFSLNETVPYFGIMIDRETGIFQYDDCKVDYISIAARTPQPGDRGEPELVTLTMGIICAAAEATAGSWPSSEPGFIPTASDAPYTIFDTDTGVTLFGEVRATEEIRLTWRNFLAAKAVNSLNVHSLRPTDRQIAFYAKIPWNSTTQDIHTTAVAGAAGSVVFTNSALSTQFNFANLMQEIRSPTIRGKNQIFYEIFAEAACSGDPSDPTNLELQVINDNTA